MTWITYCTINCCHILLTYVMMPSVNGIEGCMWKIKIFHNVEAFTKWSIIQTNIITKIYIDHGDVIWSVWSLLMQVFWILQKSNRCRDSWILLASKVHIQELTLMVDEVHKQEPHHKINGYVSNIHLYIVTVAWEIYHIMLLLYLGMVVWSIAFFLLSRKKEWNSTMVLMNIQVS